MLCKILLLGLLDVMEDIVGDGLVLHHTKVRQPYINTLKELIINFTIPFYPYGHNVVYLIAQGYYSMIKTFSVNLDLFKSI